MRIPLVLLAVAVGLVVLDRLLLAAEARGWIYWRRRKASPGTAPAALVEIQSMLEPSRAAQAEILAQRDEESEQDRHGDCGPDGAAPR